MLQKMPANAVYMRVLQKPHKHWASAVFIIKQYCVGESGIQDPSNVNPDATCACINCGDAYCPKEIKGRSICINGDIGEVLKV